MISSSKRKGTGGHNVSLLSPERTKIYKRKIGWHKFHILISTIQLHYKEIRKGRVQCYIATCYSTIIKNIGTPISRLFTNLKSMP